MRRRGGAAVLFNVVLITNVTVLIQLDSRVSARFLGILGESDCRDSRRRRMSGTAPPSSRGLRGARRTS